MTALLKHNEKELRRCSTGTDQSWITLQKSGLYWTIIQIIGHFKGNWETIWNLANLFVSIYTNTEIYILLTKESLFYFTIYKWLATFEIQYNNFRTKVEITH